VSKFSSKSRHIRNFELFGVENSYVDTALVNKVSFSGFGEFDQFTSSQGNPVSRLGKSVDIGGPFVTKSTTSNIGNSTVNVRSGGHVWYEYVGKIAPLSTQLIANVTTSAPIPSNTNQMNAFGTQAIARCLPTNPKAGLGQFLGELHDVPKIPDILNWKSRLLDIRKRTKGFNFDAVSRAAGDEYLNAVFGWVPFINDLQGLLDSIKNCAPTMIKYARGANKHLVRSYHFPSTSSTTITNLGSSFGQPSLVSNLYSAPGTLFKETRTSTNRWFKGSFTYYLPQILPDDSDFVQAINKFKLFEAFANRCYGLRLTPDLLYKLTPWSWALDWVSTTGDVIHNWSAFANDGLVMHHGYIMEQISIDETWTLAGLRLVDGRSYSPIQTRNSYVKSRAKATPYGFGANPASFTAKQWGVIAALGISKQPYSLNF